MRKVLFYLIIASLLLVLSACSDSDDADKKDEEDNTDEVSAEVEEVNDEESEESEEDGALSSEEQEEIGKRIIIDSEVIKMIDVGIEMLEFTLYTDSNYHGDYDSLVEIGWIDEFTEMQDELFESKRAIEDTEVPRSLEEYHSLVMDFADKYTLSSQMLKDSMITADGELLEASNKVRREADDIMEKADELFMEITEED